MYPWIRGALAGLGGTGVMSLALAAARVTGASGGEVPPRKISGNLKDRLGIRKELPRPVFEAIWIAQHFAYGSAAGVLYTRLEPRFRHVDPTTRGLAFGAALWALSYGGWVPALGLYPAPTERSKRRLATEIATHLVFGATTAWAAHILDGSSDRGDRDRSVR